MFERVPLGPSALPLAGNFLGAPEQEKIGLIRKKIKMTVIGVYWILQDFMHEKSG